MCKIYIIYNTQSLSNFISFNHFSTLKIIKFIWQLYLFVYAASPNFVFTINFVNNIQTSIEMNKISHYMQLISINNSSNILFATFISIDSIVGRNLTTFIMNALISFLTIDLHNFECIARKNIAICRLNEQNNTEFPRRKIELLI